MIRLQIKWAIKAAKEQTLEKSRQEWTEGNLSVFDRWRKSTEDMVRRIYSVQVIKDTGVEKL